MAHDRVVLVYQYGKVGSTSLVASLNELAGIDAYQVHFLGRRAYAAMIEAVLDGRLDSYFAKHALGQLAQNVAAERELLACEREGGETYLLTVSRDPVDWYQSAVAQDSQGTFKTFVAFAKHEGKAGRPVRHTLDTVRAEVKRLLRESDLEANPAVHGYTLLDSHKEYFADRYGRFAPMITHQLSIFFRTFSWFDEHFREYTGIRIELDAQGVFQQVEGRRHYLAVRYEDFARLPELLSCAWNIDLPRLKRENVSAAKPGAVRVAEAFASWRADKELSGLLGKTDYCVKFGYAGLQPNNATQH